MALSLAPMLVDQGKHDPVEARKAYNFWLDSGPFDYGMTVVGGLRSRPNPDSQANGGAAMMAYNYLQFSHIPRDQREKLRDRLLRYCELDAIAIVMILEGWLNRK